MSGAEPTARAPSSAPVPLRRPAPLDRTPQRYGTIVIVGGGCYGGYYVRQLRRAAAAGAVSWERLLVVDRDEGCAVARGRDASDPLAPELVVEEWSTFYARFLGEAASHPEAAARDAIVPSPLMPHLAYEWLLARARARWPGRPVETRPLASAPDTPWQRAAPDGTHYVSFATWTCPVNCIEPERCPAVKGDRAWSMPTAIDAYAAERRAAGDPVAGAVVLHCTHRVYGVGMIDVRDLLAGDALVARSGERGAAEVLVGTVSHCHGAVNRLVIG